MSTRIREFRKLRGMTLQVLATKVGTTAQTIQRLETGNMTVSLDWLMRIADVFNIPAAALLVSDTTASVPILGDMDASGHVTQPGQQEPSTALSLVISAPHPVAVHVAETIDIGVALRAYLQGSWLIGGKTELEDSVSLEHRDCLLATSDGRISLRPASIEGGKIILDPDTGSNTPQADDVAWIAPVLMAVRYF